MAKMRINTFIEALGGKLRNPRMSWGATRPDGSIILRVWFDRKMEHNGKEYVEVTDWPAARGSPGREWSHAERVEHVEQVKGGVPCLLIFMNSKVPNSAGEREIKDYQADPIYRGGEVRRFKGESWMEIGEAIPDPLSVFGTP